MVWIMLAVLLTYTSWVWAGLRPSLHAATVPVAGALLATLLLAGGPQGRGALLRDPFLWLAFLFLVYLLVQWLNAGRTLYFDVGYREWRHAPPRWSGWPWAFNRGEAGEMLAWFFPAAVVALAARSPMLSRRALQRLLLFLVYGSGALALFGLIQFGTRTKAIYWITPVEDVFFASFAYSNHAAAYFVLAGAVAAGLLNRHLFRTDESLNRGRIALLACTLVFCLIGANLSLSRAGVIIAWALGGFVAVYGFVRGWRVLRPAGRIRCGAATLAALGIFYFAVAGFGDKAIRKEFSVTEPVHQHTIPVLDHINMTLCERPVFARAAFDMWQDHPIFGVGGWGFKHLASNYVPIDKGKELHRVGWANVHCDGLQFLAEFGAVGFGLMMAALGCLLHTLLRQANRHSALWVMAVAGLFLVVALSVIDLPFRCPAILYLWLLVVAALPRLTASESTVRANARVASPYNSNLPWVQP